MAEDLENGIPIFRWKIVGNYILRKAVQQKTEAHKIVSHLDAFLLGIRNTGYEEEKWYTGWRFFWKNAPSKWCTRQMLQLHFRALTPQES